MIACTRRLCFATEAVGRCPRTLLTLRTLVGPGVFVTEVDEASPCARAGITVGMQIMAVDAIDTSSATRADVLSAIESMIDPVSGAWA